MYLFKCSTDVWEYIHFKAQILYVAYKPKQYQSLKYGNAERCISPNFIICSLTSLQNLTLAYFK